MFVKKAAVIVGAFLLVSINEILYSNEQVERFRRNQRARRVSVNLGNGRCKLTDANPLGPNPEIYGTLLASFPGSAMRLVWQHTEGLTGISVGDDYDLSPDRGQRTGIMKTAYPNLEGIWSWGDKMEQVVLIVSNLRWGIPSYHTLLYEINYARDWQTAYSYMNRIFSLRPAVPEWIKWRDYRFHHEVELWKLFIDFWMNGGEQYWMDGDYERNGQDPFHWVNETDRKIDTHCIYDMDCNPKAIISYELLLDEATGPAEAQKLAHVLDGKLGIDVIDDEARECVWHKVMDQKYAVDEYKRGRRGIRESEYVFTHGQLVEIQVALVEMRDKYSSGKWVHNELAKQLVGYLEMYIEDNAPEIEERGANMSPTPAPNAEYMQSLEKWYYNLGKGGRYEKLIKQHNTTMHL